MSPTAFRPSRRSVLAGAAAMATAFATPSILRAAPLARLALYGPPPHPASCWPMPSPPECWPSWRPR